jgi:hypothetical protein
VVNRSSGVSLRRCCSSGGGGVCVCAAVVCGYVLCTGRRGQISVAASVEASAHTSQARVC